MTSNKDMPAMPLTLADSRCLDDILVIDANDVHDDFELTIAYNNGNDSEMTFFMSKEDARVLAKALLSQLEDKGDE